VLILFSTVVFYNLSISFKLDWLTLYMTSMVFPKSYATLTIFVYVDQFFLGIPYFCDWKPGRFRTTSLIR